MPMGRYRRRLPKYLYFFDEVGMLLRLLDLPLYRRTPFQPKLEVPLSQYIDRLPSSTPTALCQEGKEY